MNPTPEQMKNVGRKMSIYMAVLMSACLSIIGVLHGNISNFLIGRFPVAQILTSILTSFLISLVISLIIGFLVPIPRVYGAATKSMKPGFGKRFVESLISDLIYTPIMTLAMTFFAYNMVRRLNGGTVGLEYFPMFLSSLIVCFIAAFILIYIFSPILLRKAMKSGGVEMPPQGGPQGPPSDKTKG